MLSVHPPGRFCNAWHRHQPHMNKGTPKIAQTESRGRPVCFPEHPTISCAVPTLNLLAPNLQNKIKFQSHDESQWQGPYCGIPVPSPARSADFQKEQRRSKVQKCSPETEKISRKQVQSDVKGAPLCTSNNRNTKGLSRGR